jgi:hypothetical protein
MLPSHAGFSRRGTARLLPSPKSADCIIATNTRLPEITPPRALAEERLASSTNGAARPREAPSPDRVDCRPSPVPPRNAAEPILISAPTPLSNVHRNQITSPALAAQRLFANYSPPALNYLGEKTFRAAMPLLVPTPTQTRFNADHSTCPEL